MLDERWRGEVDEIGEALRKLLSAESTPKRVREAEQQADGRDRALEASLEAFGLAELEAPADMFARIAYELGAALASTPYVETMPVLAILQRSGVGFGFDGPVPAGLEFCAIRGKDGLYAEKTQGESRRSAAGDWLISHTPRGDGERICDLAAADRIARFAALVEAARMTGAGQALLRIGAAYARERSQFGKPIGAYQGVAHKLADAATLLDAAELLLRKASFTALPEVGGDGAPSPAFAAMVRAKAVDAARNVAATVHQVFGGNGFAMEYDVQLYSRRLRSWAMRGRRTGPDLAELGRMVLDHKRRDEMRLLWHHDTGIPLPRWAREADALCRGTPKR